MSTTTFAGLPAGSWNILDAPRVLPLDRRSVPVLGRLVLAFIRRAEGTHADFNVFTTLARLGTIFPAHIVFLLQLLKRGRLSPVERELVILRVAWRLGCVYEWGHHVQTAKRLGVTDSEIETITTDAAAGDSSRLAAFLTATDELLADRALSSETWALARRFASDDELLELCLLVGHYVMVAMTLNSVGVQLEDEFVTALAKPAPTKDRRDDRHH
jgi:AhpD family alkylhydroperoxidase